MKVTELAKQLISIPSYSSAAVDEAAMGQFLVEFIGANFPWLRVERQYVDDRRFNVFVTDGFPVRLLAVDHIDTVAPGVGWQRDPFTPVVEDGRLYGRGATDTKGAIAAWLGALASLNAPTSGLACLFYVGEETNFAGMKSFVNSVLARKIRPGYVLSLDGSGLELTAGCRGLVEFELRLGGKSGHSANPGFGRNVITGYYEVLEGLAKWMRDVYSDDLLGEPTLNPAYVRAGFRDSVNSEGVINFGTEGNIIPDYLEAIVEIRTTNSKLTLELVEEKLRNIARDKGLKLLGLEAKHNLQGFRSESNEVLGIIQQVYPRAALADVSKFGYLDIAMLADLYPEATLVSFGCGTKGQAHALDEYVEVADLETAALVYKKTIETLAQ